MRDKPLGVTVVGILTILGGFAIVASSIVGLIFGVISYFLAVAGFGVIVLIDGILVLRSLRLSLYLSIVVWILVFIFLCLFYSFWDLSRFFGLYFQGGYLDLDSLWLNFELISPFIYVIGCLLYFQKRQVKEFFLAKRAITNV